MYLISEARLCQHPWCLEIDAGFPTLIGSVGDAYINERVAGRERGCILISLRLQHTSYNETRAMSRFRYQRAHNIALNICALDEACDCKGLTMDHGSMTATPPDKKNTSKLERRCPRCVTIQSDAGYTVAMNSIFTANTDATCTPNCTTIRTSNRHIVARKHDAKMYTVGARHVALGILRGRARIFEAMFHGARDGFEGKWQN